MNFADRHAQLESEIKQVQVLIETAHLAKTVQVPRVESIIERLGSLYDSLVKQRDELVKMDEEEK